MRLPEDMKAELYKIKDELSGDELAIVEAVVKDCASMCNGVGYSFANMLMGAPLSRAESMFLDATENCATEIRARYGLET